MEKAEKGKKARDSGRSRHDSMPGDGTVDMVMATSEL